MQLQTPVCVRPAQPLLNCAGAPSQETIMAARSAARFLAAGVIKAPRSAAGFLAAGGDQTRHDHRPIVGSRHDSLNLSVASMILSEVPLRLLSDAVQQLTAPVFGNSVPSKPKMSVTPSVNATEASRGSLNSVRSLNCARAVNPKTVHAGFNHRTRPVLFCWVEAAPSALSHPRAPRRGIPGPTCLLQGHTGHNPLPALSGGPAKLIGQIAKFRANEVAGR